MLIRSRLTNLLIKHDLISGAQNCTYAVQYNCYSTYQYSNTMHQPAVIAVGKLIAVKPAYSRFFVKRLHFDSKSLLHNANAVRFGWSKEALTSLIPMTSTLISSRGRSYENIGVGYCLQEPPVITEENPSGLLRVDDSWLEMVVNTYICYSAFEATTSRVITLYILF